MGNWVPKHKTDVKKIIEKKLKPTDIKEEDRLLFRTKIALAFGNLVPRDVASRAAKGVTQDMV